MGENHLASTPTAAYGFVLLMAAIAYWILQRAIIARQGRESLLASAIGSDWKGKLSPAPRPKAASNPIPSSTSTSRACLPLYSTAWARE